MQKYLLHWSKSKRKFMASYDKGMNKFWMKEDSNRGGKTKVTNLMETCSSYNISGRVDLMPLSCGEVASHLTCATLNEKMNASSSMLTCDPLRPSDVGEGAGEGHGARGVLILLKLTNTSK